MRAKTKLRYIIPLSLIALLALFLFLFAFTVPVASADVTSSYLDADVTVGGTVMPSVLRYTGGAIDYGFALYQSADKTDWTDASAYADRFEIRFYDQSGALLDEDHKPCDVGVYTARVYAKETVYGFKNTSGNSIVTNVAVSGEKLFRIARDNLSLFCTPLDKVSSFILSDEGLTDEQKTTYYQEVFTSIKGGVSLLLAGEALTLDTDYSVVVQRKNGEYETIVENDLMNPPAISAVGDYRLKVTVSSSVSLAKTIEAEDVLEKDGGGNYILYREFSVTRARFSLSLNRTTMYVDRASAVTLNNAASLAGIVSYKTQVFSLSDGVEGNTDREALKASSAGAVSYTPTEVGSYVYRVIFTEDKPGYGIAANDYADLSFTVKATPYTVGYLINKNKDDTLAFRNYVINNPEEELMALQPVFYDTTGKEITAVYDQSSSKFSVTYEKYNTGTSSWDVADELREAGKYCVIIEFKEDVQIVSGAEAYTIPRYNPPSETFRIRQEFRIITHGSLSVVPSNNGVNYYDNGNPVVPNLTFYSSLMDDAAAAVLGKYDLYYFTPLATTTAPSAVGKYAFQLVFTSAVDSLNIEVGDVFDGQYTIEYLPLSIEIGESVAFIDVLSGNPFTPVLNTDYTLSTYKLTDNLYAGVASTASSGYYVKRVTFLQPFVSYGVAAGDSFFYGFSVDSLSVLTTIKLPSDLTYDGGIKEPTVTFSEGVNPVDLVELVDYQISYFRYDADLAKYLPSGQPLLAGSYRCVVTFLKTDEVKGIVRGSFKSSDFVIASKVIATSFAVKEESVDLVYDGGAKEYVVSFKRDSRPVALACTVKYAVREGVGDPVYGVAAYTDAGDYWVKATLTDDLEGSLLLSQDTLAFTIAKLRLKVHFEVPLSYSAMWTGSEVAPEVTYLAQAGKFASAEAKTAAEWKTALGVGVNISLTKYYLSDSGIEISPVKTGTYRQEIISNNGNILFSAASAIGDDGNTVTAPYLAEGKANQVYTIIPREVEIKPIFDPDLYYTGERKGVKDGGISFFAYNNESKKYDVEVIGFAGDYVIRYYQSEDSKGTISTEEYSFDKPFEKAYYVARILLKKDGVADEYITENRYTFKDGKKEKTPLNGVAIEDDCYVDFVFRISDQKRLDVIFNMPDTFAANGEDKAISVTFLNKFSEVPLVAGDDKDYTIRYLSVAEDGTEGAEQAAAFSAIGKYKMKITFRKKNVEYRLDTYYGEYTKANDLYISAGDTLVYAFEITAPRALTVTFSEPEGSYAVIESKKSYYYTGDSKGFGATFSVSEGGVASVVTLTYGTHFRVNYYKLASGGKYESIAVAPTVPGDYAVEVVFLKDLPDYTYVLNEVQTPISVAAFTTIKGADGIYADAKTPRLEYKIGKAILVLGGISANNKDFDGTDSVTFTGTPVFTVKTIGTAACGRMITDGDFSFEPQGEIKGAFSSLTPAESILVNVENNFTLPTETQKYYELDAYPEYRATIAKATVQVKPVNVTREYDPMSIISIIDYDFSTDEKTAASLAVITSLYPTLQKKDLLKGSLSYSGSTAVGRYPISLDSLSFNDEGAGVVYADKHLSDLFTLNVESAEYVIIERAITVSVTDGQFKIYGNVEPSYETAVTSGSLIYHDFISCTVTRATGENAGNYALTLSSAKVTDESGVDVSSNYRITLKSGSFEIKKRTLKIAPKNQTATYLVGFNDFDMEVLDADANNKNVTEAYVTSPTTGDRLSGKLAKEATDDPCVFKILRGTVNVVNAAGKSVSSNYIIIFDTSRTYTITPIAIEVSLAGDVVLQKYFGDKDPIIGFTISDDERSKLGRLTLSEYSSVGRIAGENAGEYYVLRDNSAGSFLVMDSGANVSDYFSFTVRDILYDGQKVFTILPRPVTVTVEDATYDNTGREIVPVIKYLNANGSRLSATVLSLLTVAFEVPQVEYKDGANLVTPRVVGEVTSDPNFDITLKAGTITVNYLENTVTATAIPKTDTIYAEHKYILSGIMLYKTVKFYKLETANGAQPSRKVEISLPVEEEIKGNGLVIIAMYADSSTKAISFSQSGDSLLYADNGAYYAAVAEVQEWFYIIWGVVIIIGFVILYFLVRLVLKLLKKMKNNKEAKAASAKEGANEEPVELTDEQIKEYAAMDVTLLDESMNNQKDSAEPEEAEAAQPDTEGSKEALSEDLTDALSDAPVLADTAPELSVAPATPVAAEPEPVLSDDGLADYDALQDAPVAPSITPRIFAPVAEPEALVPAEEEAVPEESAKEKKGKKAKEEKKPKKEKEKKKKANAPTAFMPSSFMPKGNKSAAYVPTRSYMDDLFIDEEKEASSDDALSDSATLSDSAELSSSAIVSPTNHASPSASKDDDEIVVSRSGGFSDFDDEEEGDKGDDML